MTNIKYASLLIGLLTLPLLFNFAPLEVLRLKTFDALVQTPEPSGHFTILNITEEDVQLKGGYPFPRQDLANIHIELLNKGALGVGWVILFPQDDRFNGDKVFADVLSYAPSVLAMPEFDNGMYPETHGTVILGPDVELPKAKGFLQNIRPLSNSATQGAVSAPVDVDNLVRRLPLLQQTPDGWVAAFGTEVLKTLAGANTYQIKTNENGIEMIRVKGLPPISTDSLGRKWISWVDTNQTTLEEMDVEGTFVFVGVTAAGVMPQLATPKGLLEPHKIQTALAESILIPDSPSIPDWGFGLEIAIFVLFVALSWLVLTSFGVTWGLGIGAFLMLSVASGGYAMIQKGLLIDVSWTLISQFITSAIAFYLRFREQYKLRQQIKKQFEHYLDPRQIKRLQDNPELLKLGGEKKTATFLFTDVRGFTSMSESLPPEKVTYIMNKALTAQQTAVQKHDGMVDKYIGDAMMAIFNAPLDIPEHQHKAIDCAKDIVKNMAELNKELQAEGLPEIAIGIGINTGEAVIGNMGSASRFDYTAIGDAVNTAARLESATKELKVNILIGIDTANSCKYDLRYLNDIQVKGKAFPIKVYGI